MRIKRPKVASYELMPEGNPAYRMLDRLIEAHHEHLTNAKVALAWNRSWKRDVDGRRTLGKCRKASELDRELAPYDFVIVLQEEFWTNPLVKDKQREALLDHELCHAEVARDKAGEPKTDAKGRTLYRIRKHDIEEFAEIAARHGVWKRDLEAFARALQVGSQGKLFEKHPSPEVSAIKESVAAAHAGPQ
jgi:hypothetical protein